MRVLIVRVGAMGDVLHALPAVAALRKARPEWTIDWVVDERWQTLLGGGEGEAGLVVRRSIPVPTRAWKEAPFSWATLRSVAGFRRLRGQYDLVVDMQGTMRSALLSWLAGGSKLAGYVDPREALAARLYGRKIARLGEHVVDQGAALLGAACGLELTPLPAPVAAEGWAEEWAAAEAVVRRPLCVLAPGAGWAAKQWPAVRFGELARGLRAQGFDVVVNAPRRDNRVAAEVVAASDGAARMVVSNVAGLVALLRRTDLFVGGDSGPTHLAAALAVPLVALFGPTNPARNGPWGPGRKTVLRHAASATSYKRSDEADAGLGRIGVAEVLAAALAVAEAVPPSPPFIA